MAIKVNVFSNPSILDNPSNTIIVKNKKERRFFAALSTNKQFKKFVLMVLKGEDLNNFWHKNGRNMAYQIDSLERVFDSDLPLKTKSQPIYKNINNLKELVFKNFELA